MRAVMRATILENPWIPHEPTPKQAEFLLMEDREALFGGAAGGGKSDALLTAALQYVEVPNYAAILFRKTFADLALPGALMDRAQGWLAGTDAKWNERDKTWLFPSGATVGFGYLEHENHKYRYQSAEFQFIGFDELTQFSESQYRYLFSRLRRLEGSKVPLRMRSASNPGGIGHEWVKQRFIIEKPNLFVSANLADNPYLDREEYTRSLMQLDPVARRQLLDGDWSARQAGNKFRREWFEVVDEAPANASRVRYWDLAATEPKPGKDPDWTAGVRMSEKDGIFYVEDIKRLRQTPRHVESLIRQTAELDGRAVDVYMEQEPGSSGVNTIDHYRRRILLGFAFRGNKTTGSKEVRANPLSAAAEAGNVKLVRGPWINAFLDEIESFPLGSHDDQVDSTSGAFEMLVRRKKFGVIDKPKGW